MTEFQETLLAQLEAIHQSLQRMEKRLEWISGFEDRLAGRLRGTAESTRARDLREAPRRELFSDARRPDRTAHRGY